MKNQIVTKLKNSNYANLKKLNCDNSKTQIVIVIKITVVTEVVIKHLNTLTTDQLSGQLFATLAMFKADHIVPSLPTNKGFGAKQSFGSVKLQCKHLTHSCVLGFKEMGWGRRGALTRTEPNVV